MTTIERKTTDVGKVLRKLRVDRDEKLIDMAAKVGRTASFLSAIEVGKKTAPADFVESVVEVYGLDDDHAEELRRAADRTRKEFKITPQGTAARDLTGLLARKIDTLSAAQLTQIHDILRKPEGK